MLKARFLAASPAALGKEITEQLLARLLEQLVDTQQVEQSGTFYTIPQAANVPVRDRSKLPAYLRKFEYVHDSELDVALIQLVKDAIMIHPQDAIHLLFKLLGYGRLSYKPQQRVFDRIVRLLENSRLALHENWVMLAPKHAQIVPAAKLVEFLKFRPRYVKRKRGKSKLEHQLEQEEIEMIPYQSSDLIESYRRYLNQQDVQKYKWRLDTEHGRFIIRYLPKMRFDLETQTFVERLAGANRRSDRYTDIYRREKMLTRKMSWVGTVAYDLITGVFVTDGFFTGHTNLNGFTDRLIRAWRNPHSGSMMGRSSRPGEPNSNKPFYFSHANLNILANGRVEKAETVQTNGAFTPIGLADEFGKPVQAYETAIFDALIRAESPVHMDYLVYQYKQALESDSSKVKQFVDRLVHDAVEHGVAKQFGEFVWLGEMKRPLPRNRAKLADRWRKLDFVALQEIEEAILLILKTYDSMLPKELYNLVGFLLLGKKRLGEQQKDVVDAALESLKLQSKIKLNDQQEFKLT